MSYYGDLEDQFTEEGKQLNSVREAVNQHPHALESFNKVKSDLYKLKNEAALTQQHIWIIQDVLHLLNIVTKETHYHWRDRV